MCNCREMEKDGRTKSISMKKYSFQISMKFPASATKIYALLTQARYIKQWSGQQGKIQLTVGGKFELFNGWVKGVVLAFQREKMISVTWKPIEWSAKTQASIVTVLLTSYRAETKLQVKHFGFPSKKEANQHKKGWNQFVFQPLKTYLLYIE